MISKLKAWDYRHRKAPRHCKGVSFYFVIGQYAGWSVRWDAGLRITLGWIGAGFIIVDIEAVMGCVLRDLGLMKGGPALGEHMDGIMTTEELARLRADTIAAMTARPCDPLAVVQSQAAYIAALEARVAALDGWKPVTETEPATCTVALLSAIGCGIYLGWRVDGRWLRDDARALRFFPTHYRPLPEPPVKP